MTRSQRISSVLKLAERKEKNAARVAIETRQKLHMYESKLNELRQFRSEYSIDFTSTDHAMTSNLLRERQQFLHQVDAGIRILTNTVEGHRHTSHIDDKTWMEAYKYSHALDKLVDKVRSFELHIDEMREENELDDRSQHRKVKI